MSLSYQTLLGESSVTADYISVNKLSADTITTQEFSVTGTAVINELQIPNGGQDGYVLTSNPFGVASWQPDPNVSLLGDATGLLTANRVDTLAGGTINVTNLVTLTGTQTLTNKSLTSPIINTIASVTNSSSAVITLPSGASARTLSTLSGIETLNNKTLSSPILNTITSFTNTVGSIITVPSGSTARTLVTLDGTETLSNKSLTLPVISSISNGGTVTIPAGTRQLVARDTPDTLTNKTLSGNVCANITNSGIVTFPTGTRTLVARDTTDTLTNKTISGNVCSNLINTGTITLPTVTGTLSTLANAETLTNKTITGTTNSVEANSMRNGSTWVVPYSGGAPATNNILTYNGTNAIWAAPAATTAGNLTGDVTSVGLATSILNTVVTGKTLSGYVVSSGTVASTDSILQAFQKDVGNLTALTTVVGTPVSTATNNAIAKRDGSAGCAFNALTCTTLGSSGLVTANSLAVTNNATVGGSTNVATLTSSGLVTANSLNVTNTAYIAGALSTAPSFQAGRFSYSAPTSQGAWLGWNRGVGSSGRTAFMTQQGLGIGGFEWLNYDNSNVLTSPNPLMYLDASGNLITNGYIKGTPVFYQGWCDSILSLTSSTLWSKISFPNFCLYSTARFAQNVTASASSPFTWRTGASIIFATSVQ